MHETQKQQYLPPICVFNSFHPLYLLLTIWLLGKTFSQAIINDQYFHLKKMYIYMCICVWVCAHEFRCLGRLKALAPLDLEVTGGCKHSTWVLGTELGTSVRAVCTLDYGATSPAQSISILYL